MDIIVKKQHFVSPRDRARLLQYSVIVAGRWIITSLKENSENLRHYHKKHLNREEAVDFLPQYLWKKLHTSVWRFVWSSWLYNVDSIEKEYLLQYSSTSWLLNVLN